MINEFFMLCTKNNVGVKWEFSEGLWVLTLKKDNSVYVHKFAKCVTHERMIDILERFIKEAK